MSNWKLGTKLNKLQNLDSRSNLYEIAIVTPQFSGILKMLEKFKNSVSCLFVVGLSTLVGL